MTVSLADVLPGVPSANLAQVSEWVVGVAMLTTASGVVGQRLLARRSIGLQVALVTVVTVVTAIASVAVISVCCLSLADRQVMLELMGIAGIAGLAVAFVIGRSVTRATGRLARKRLGFRMLMDVVRTVADLGHAAPSRSGSSTYPEGPVIEGIIVATAARAQSFHSDQQARKTSTPMPLGASAG